MTRFRIVATHVLAVPLSVILSIALSTALAPLTGRHGIDVSLHDTFYVVAHFHPTAFLGVFLTVSALIVRAYGAPTRWLWAACGLAIVHLAAAILMRAAWVEVLVGYGFLASAVLAFGTGLVALGVSAVAALRRSGQPAAPGR